MDIKLTIMTFKSYKPTKCYSMLAIILATDSLKGFNQILKERPPTIFNFKKTLQLQNKKTQ